MDDITFLAVLEVLGLQTEVERRHQHWSPDFHLAMDVVVETVCLALGADPDEVREAACLPGPADQARRPN